MHLGQITLFYQINGDENAVRTSVQERYILPVSTDPSAMWAADCVRGVPEGERMVVMI